jgi:hypothetical protein
MTASSSFQVSGPVFDPDLAFPCLDCGLDDDRAILFADWAGGHQTYARREARAASELLPEAGRAVFYRTGHGLHVIWSNPVRREDALAALDLLGAQCSCRWYTIGVIGGQGLGHICAGFTEIYRQHAGRLRVGRKPGRGRDIRRITPRRPDDSAIIRAHDALVKHYNHRGRPWRAQANAGVPF